MIKIFQILGPLDVYKELNLSLLHNKGNVHSKLSAIALYQLLEDPDKQIIFIIPESNIASLDIENDQAINYLKDIQRHKNLWRKQILQKILSNSQKIQFDIKIVQSIGNYKFKDKNQHLIFDNYLNNIICDLFLSLFSLDQNGARIIIDISTGHSIYTHAMIEALRSYIVYSKLQNIIKKETKVSAEIATIPPAIPTISDSKFQISLEPYDVKAFFEFPLKAYRFDDYQKVISLERLSNEEKKKIGPIIPKLDKAAESLIELAKIAFNTIKFNAPLALFIPKIIDLRKKEKLINEQQSIILKVLDFIHEKRIVENSNGNILVTSLGIQKDKLINFYFILALLSSITHFYKESIKDTCPIPERIRDIFTNLYFNLDLGTNGRFLERDLNYILSKKDLIQPHTIILLRELFQNQEQIKGGNQDIKNEQGESTPLISDNKRNFFAHSGLLREFTKVIKSDKDILYLSYEKIYYETIKSWLLNPQK